MLTVNHNQQTKPDQKLFICIADYSMNWPPCFVFNWTEKKLVKEANEWQIKMSI